MKVFFFFIGEEFRKCKSKWDISVVFVFVKIVILLMKVGVLGFGVVLVSDVVNIVNVVKKVKVLL